MSSNFGERAAGERAANGGAAAASGGGGSRSLHAPPGLFPAVAAALLPYPLTHGVRAALFELMLGGQPVPAGRVRPLPRARSKTRVNFTRVSSAVSSAASAAGRFLGSHSRSASSVDGSFVKEGGDPHPRDPRDLSSPLRLDGGAGAATSGVPGIVHAAAAGVLLRLLEKCEDAEVRGGALETLLRLVEGAPANAHALLTQAGWQQWLIPALCFTKKQTTEDETEEKELASATDADPDEEARSLTRRLLRALLSHATLRVENGCAAMVTTGDVIAAAAERGRLDGPRTTRALLGDIFDAVAEEAPVAQFAATRRDNLFGLLPLAEETVARAAAAAAGSLVTKHTRSSSGSSRDADGADKSSGEADGSGGDETAKPLFDEDDWQMLDGTWRLLEALAKDATPSPTSTALASGGEAASRVGGIAAGDRESSTRLAALQRTAFHLAIVYVHAAPLEASSLSAAPRLSSRCFRLRFLSGTPTAAAAARLHLFLTSPCAPRRRSPAPTRRARSPPRARAAPRRPEARC